MKPIIAVLITSYDPSFVKALEVFKTTDNNTNSDWDIRIVRPNNVDAVPLTAYWVIRGYTHFDLLPQQREHETVIALTGTELAPCFLSCYLDETSFPLLAAQHFAEGSYRHVAIIGDGKTPRSQQRLDSFIAAAENQLNSTSFTWQQT